MNSPTVKRDLKDCKTNRMHVENASQGFSLLLQSGVEISCTVNLPLMQLLQQEFKLSQGQIDALDVFLLDGKPVDSPKETIVPDGSRLALAAGLPGIAGLAMKSNSAVKGLRPGITHGVLDATGTPSSPAHGSMELVLYSLALKNLAGHFLASGFTLKTAKALEALETGLQGDFTINGQTLDRAGALRFLASLPAESSIYLTASIASS